MTDLELQKLETIAEDIDTMCNMTMLKANTLAKQYTLEKFGRTEKNFTAHILDLIKIRLIMRIEKEIFGHDN